MYVGKLYLYQKCLYRLSNIHFCFLLPASFLSDRENVTSLGTQRKYRLLAERPSIPNHQPQSPTTTLPVTSNRQDDKLLHLFTWLEKLARRYHLT